MTDFVDLKTRRFFYAVHKFQNCDIIPKKPEINLNQERGDADDKTDTCNHYCLTDGHAHGV